MKLLLHVLVFLVGCGVGIWWGVNHPTQAASIAAVEQTKVSQAKIEVLQKLADTPSTSNTTIKRMLADEQKKLQAAKGQ